MFSSDIFNTKSIQTLGKKSLIGKGASGCIIKPPITEEFKKEYIPYQNASDNDVGKLFRGDLKNAFKAELKIFAGIHERDPNHTFTVALKGANALSKSLITEHMIRACLEDDADDMIYQIIMEYGGKELKKITKDSVSFTTFIQLFRVFLLGIQRMHSFNVVHRDIKPSNVLLSDMKLSLIDFGISEDAKKVFNKESKEYLTYLYLYYPPEFYMAGLLLKYRNNKKRFLEKLDTILDTMHTEYLPNIFKERQIYNIRNQLQDFINEIKINDYAYYDVFNESLAYKCDVYGIGFLIRELGNKLSYASDKEKIMIYNMYKLCSEINPYKRATLAQLISYIDNYINVSDDIASKLFTGGIKNRKKGKRIRLTFAKLHDEECNKLPPKKSKKAYRVFMNMT